MQREQFRRYVALYVDALHSVKPGYQITSNWMYSTFVPERPKVPLDYLSGDLSDTAALLQARIQARYLSRCGKPWDLMSWGLEKNAQFGQVEPSLPRNLSRKPPWCWLRAARIRSITFPRAPAGSMIGW